MTPGHQIFLDLIEQHTRSGDECVLIHCSGELPVCTINQQHKLSTCYLCRHRFKQGIKWLGRKFKVERVGNLSIDQHRLIREVTERDFGSTQSIEEFELESDDVGSAAISATISALREPYPDYHQYKDLIHKNLTTAILVHYSIKNLLEKYKPDRLVLFNGRVSTQRPALRIGVAKNIETFVIESGWDGDLNRHILTKETYSHNVDKCSNYIDEVFKTQKYSEQEKLKIGLSFFEQQRKTPFASGNSLTLKGDSFEVNDCKIVTIFNSSEDEFVCVPECKNPFYRNEEEALTRIIGDLLNLGTVKVILRVHPNLRGINNSQTDAIYRIKERFNDGLTVFDADSKVDSYDLMQQSDIVVTFGSTTGIEAAYHGKTSVLMGRAFYESLSCIIKPQSHSDFVQFVDQCERNIVQPDYLTASERLRELAQYGFFARKFGYEAQFRYFNAESWENYLIKDGIKTYLETPWTLSVYPRIKNLIIKLAARFK